MKKSIILILFIFFTTLQLFSQKEAFTWYFGEYAGIDFNNNVSPRPLTNNNVMDQLEGCATISDPNGEMLFFTDGKTIWNRIFKPMPNGQNLMGARSSTQSAIIVPDPGDYYQYYVFTIDSENGGHGLRYSIIDIRLDYGLGDVKSDHKNILLYQNVTEKLTAVNNNESPSYWIATHEVNTNSFLAFLLTENGLSHNPIISNGIVIHSDKVGYMKFSPDGGRVACTIKGMDLIELYNFDQKNGRVTLNKPIIIDDLPGVYGLEFSPDGTQLYVSWKDMLQGRISQFDLTAGDGGQIPVENSQKVIAFDYQYLYGAIQLGPDGLIYIAKYLNDYTGHTFLDAITNPNSYQESNFIRNFCSLNNRQSKAGLPNFVQSFFKPKAFTFDGVCANVPIQFDIPNKSNIDSVLWFFDDPNSIQNFSTLLNPVYTFKDAGTFSISLSIFSNGIKSDYLQTFRIYPQPHVYLGPDTSICHPIILSAGDDALSYLWSSGSTESTIIVYESNQDQIFWVQIHDFICSNADTIVIKSCTPCDVFIPNAFSPNDDGINDRLCLLGSNFSSFELVIYNYRGREVFRTNSSDGYWDGTLKGKKLEMGVYVYTLKAKCIDGSLVQKTGNISLLR
jgi:large repetitive protein